VNDRRQVRQGGGGWGVVERKQDVTSEDFKQIYILRFGLQRHPSPRPQSSPDRKICCVFDVRMLRSGNHRNLGSYLYKKNYELHFTCLNMFIKDRREGA